MIHSLKNRFFNTLCGLLILVLCASCTGLNQKELANDPVIKETERINTFLSVERTQFFQLQRAYLSSHKAAHLERMAEIMELIRDELERADYFHKYNRYYRTGMDHQRWKKAQETYSRCRDILCEMMLVLGQLHLEKGDKEYAQALFNTVVHGFDSDEIPGFVRLANRYLQEMQDSKQYAASDKSVHKEIH